MTPMGCAEVHELAAELALDLLTGPERAAVLAHLTDCTACRADVASLTDVGEALLAIAPEVEPSAGFESRLISRISTLRDEAGPVAGAGRPVEPVGGGGRRARGHRLSGRRRVWLAAGAAAALVTVVALTVALAAGRGGDGSGDGTGDTVAGAVGTESADLRTASGRVVGTATLSDDDPAVVTVDMGDWADRLRSYGESGDHSYWLTVGAGDDTLDTYSLPLGVPGPWRVALDGDEGAGAVTSVAVVDETGNTWCDARFTQQ
jgi:hypothetical protein